MIERRIKELSIALEALSRINGYAACVHSDQVSDLLKQAINEAKEANKPHTTEKPQTTDSNDDIPF